MSLFLFYFTPVGLIVWISLAMWHMRRQHQIREKSAALYYLLLAQDAIGLAADVAGNYTWASVILLDCPRMDRREITISQHMSRINEDDKRFPPASVRQRWSRFVARNVCRQLNKLEKDGKRHC